MNKKNLSESDICDPFIRPAMVATGWSGVDSLHREFPLGAGRVAVRGPKAQRDPSSVLWTGYARLQTTGQTLRDELKAILAQSLEGVTP